MQLVNVIQGTSEWKAFRRSHICASDAIVILGRSPWKSLQDLYEEKVLGFEQEENPYMSRGKALESLALENFEKETGLEMFPLVFKDDHFAWMAVSYDGITLNKDTIVEIKCPGRKDHDYAVSKKMIPSKYEPQIQHQMYVADLDFAYYYSFDGQEGVIIEVKRDQALIDFLLEKEQAFWHCLQDFSYSSAYQ
jgi:putative phage-type endonuclease